MGPDERSVRDIYETVSRGYEWIFKTGQGEANWKLVDHTSLVAIALVVREPKNSPWIKAIKKWLISQQTEMEPGVASWGDSVSDTSMVVLALIRMGVQANDPVIQKGLAFLNKIFYANGRANWEDEPWETSWAILAISQSGNAENLDEACQAASWLMGIQDANGAIIAPHYTGYSVKVADTICRRQGLRGYCVLNEQMYKEKAKKASEYLLGIIDEEILWTGEAWSNGQILWALASSGHFPFEDQVTVRKVVDWFMRNQRPDGNWYDAEDTACAIMGLVSLLKGLILAGDDGQLRSQDPSTIIYNHLRRMYEAPRLVLRKRFIEVQDDGTTTLNFSPRALKAAAILFAILSGLTVFIALWDFIRESLGM